MDLQLGGKDVLENLQGLDRSVNRSLGIQIHNQLKQYEVGQVIGNVIIND